MSDRHSMTWTNATALKGWRSSMYVNVTIDVNGLSSGCPCFFAVMLPISMKRPQQNDTGP